MQHIAQRPPIVLVRPAVHTAFELADVVAIHRRRPAGKLLSPPVGTLGELTLGQTRRLTSSTEQAVRFVGHGFLSPVIA